MQIRYTTRLIDIASMLHGYGLVLLFFTSCFDPQLENIGCVRGEECPSGLVCDGILYTCVAPEQAAAGVWRCGNGILEMGELCDDGNRMDGDGCSGDCLSDETCGNGIIDLAAMEECDDGNRKGGDGCSVECRHERCGNNAECPGGQICGNGIQDSGEQCDEGGESAKCDASCTIAYCGDGELNAMRGEECDDAGESTSCDWNCTLRACGDRIVNIAAGEECDDGNTNDGDGCNPTCMIEQNPAMPRSAEPVF